MWSSFSRLMFFSALFVCSSAQSAGQAQSQTGLSGRTRTVSRRASCADATSTKASGKKVCDNKLIFEENFDNFDGSVWQNEIRFPDRPDYEFVMYDDSRNNTYVKNGILYIRPTLLSDVYGENFLKTGEIKLDDYPSRCTSPVGDPQCFRSGQKGFRILPPIISSKIKTSKFSFRYGEIEIKAKIASGDWIYSDISLTPKSNRYGAKYSGKIFVATARGNSDLKNPSIKDKRLNFGNKWLESGAVLETYNPKSSIHMKASLNTKDGWQEDFHVYKLVWKRDSMEWTLDDQKIGSGKLTPPEKGFLQWRNVPKMAPFDEEFYITIGVGVGGIQRFPDEFQSKGRPKPWKNLSPKGMMQFWNDKENWYNTWKGEDSALQIDYIKVRALP